jgi:hypothetical protein
MNAALRHEEPDRVPIGDFFWGTFIHRWQQELNLPADASPYSYYDLDWIVTVPNLDPHIRPFDTLQEDAEGVTVKTGFEAIVRKHFAAPMPEAIGWETDSLDKLEALEFDAAEDPRRLTAAGDNHLGGVGDGFARNSPAWLETVKSLRPDIAVYGSVIESAECLTRLIGQMNMLIWIGEEPERLGGQILRIGDFYYRCLQAQIAAGEGLLDGMVIWGDVAYKHSLLFSPHYWRRYFKPTVARMIALCHQHHLPVIYHGCGNVAAILPDFIEMGLDAYNPLEAKAGLDVVALRRQYGHQLAFCGNSDITVWESGDQAAIRREVLRKLNAAKGGGFIFQSDHSVTSAVSGRTYDEIVRLVREFGNYPLRLGEFEEA